MDINAITVCVHYDDLLRLTLPSILPHVTRILIVTSPDDVLTHMLAVEFGPKVQIYKTDAFYRNGASFNKGLAMEEGFDVLGRNGWILILDADIVLPSVIPPWQLTSGKLYTPARRILSDVDNLSDVSTIRPETLPLRKENGNFGYFQLFHANDPVLRQRPWYATDFVHAGGCDSVFQKKWHKNDRLRMPFEVVHLGDPDQNWYGRSTARIDTKERPPQAEERLQKQNALHRKYGWKGHTKTGEAVVERLTGDPAKPEECHNHEDPPTKTKVVTQTRTGRRHTTAKPPQPPTPQPPATPKRAPTLRAVQPIRGLKKPHKD